MRYIWQHIGTVIETYNGSVPLTHFLRNYYRLHPKLGSRDRKILSEMAYCWYRCSKGFDAAVPFEGKLKACLYLCETGNKHIRQFLPDEWQESRVLPVEEKIRTLQSAGYSFNLNAIAPSNVGLSDGIDKGQWLLSMLSQPYLFIRLRKNKPKVLSLLKEQNVSFHEYGDCVALPNGTAVEKILPANCYVVQDASSQYTGTYFRPAPHEKWWECCSGAGGKALLLMDAEPAVQLTVSDKRASILHNLNERFRQYSLPVPRQLVLDTSDKNALNAAMEKQQFDHIICDVPCTGSGTWARTPEQLYYSDKALAGSISSLQTSIAVNAASLLKAGGTMFYITYSVFREENEAVVAKLMEQTKLQLNKTELINGIEKKADSMFIAVLQKA